MVPKILRWVCAANDPFTIDQLREALAIDPDTGLLQWDQMMSARDLLRSCANLLTRNSTDHVLLVHHFLRQFLIARPVNSNPFSEGFGLSVGRLELGELCVMHLGSPAYSLSVKNVTKTSNLTVQLPPAVMTRLTEVVPPFLRFALPQPKPTRITVPTRRRDENITGHLPDFFYFAREQWALLTSEISTKSRVWDRFSTLVMQPNLSWRLHPWEPLGQSLNSHYMGLLGWATVNNQLPMLWLVVDERCVHVRGEIFDAPLPNYGNLPVLHLAAKTSHERVVKRLISRCNPQMQDVAGRTPIHYAAEIGNGGILNRLINEGGLKSVEIFDHKDKTALHLAAANGHEKVVQDLIRETIINWRDSNGNAAIDMAIAGGHREVASILLYNKAVFDLLGVLIRGGEVADEGLNCLTGFLNTGLVEAAQAGNRTMAEQAVKRGGLNSMSLDFAYYCATKHEHWAILQLLQKYDHANTISPLMRPQNIIVLAAASTGYREIVRRGFTYSQLSSEFIFCRLLYLAKRGGYEGIIKELHGYFFEAGTEGRCEILDSAIRFMYQGTADLLLLLPYSEGISYKALLSHALRFNGEASCIYLSSRDFGFDKGDYEDLIGTAKRYGHKAAAKVLQNKLKQLQG